MRKEHREMTITSNVERFCSSMVTFQFVMNTNLNSDTTLQVQVVSSCHSSGLSVFTDFLFRPIGYQCLKPFIQHAKNYYRRNRGLWRILRTEAAVYTDIGSTFSQNCSGQRRSTAHGNCLFAYLNGSIRQWILVLFGGGSLTHCAIAPQERVIISRQ